LLDPTATHEDDAIGHAHGFGLIMRHVDHGNAKPLLEGTNFTTQILPQLGIEIGQRLIEQAHRRFGDQGASKRHPLLLAAGQLAGLAP